MGSKLGFELPNGLDRRLRKYIPWGSKGAIITELLYQLVEAAEKDNGKSVYKVIKQASEREKRHAT